MSDYDVIIIGSGAGGLAAAVALSNSGKRVLVLEQHYLPGGWCHSFHLGGHRYSPGVHYVGQLKNDGALQTLLEGLGVGGDLSFHELNPDGYDHVVVGDRRFDIPAGKERFIARLKESFPHEARGIDRYFKLMTAVDRELGRLMKLKGPLSALKIPFVAPRAAFYGPRAAAAVINRHVSDPFLRTVLEVRAGDHGVCPTRVPFAMQVAVEAHYWDGAWYPEGGGGAFPKAFLKRLRKNGGEIRMRTRVQRVLVEGAPGARRAVGVELADGQTISADAVVSNADALVTYRELLDPEVLSARTNRKVNGLEYSISAMSLFLGVSIDPEQAGLDSGNYWISRNPDVSECYRYAEIEDLATADDPPGLFLTIPTLKDPSGYKGGDHTMEAFTFVSHQAFRRFADSKYGERPEEYQAFKEALAGRMVKGLEAVIPDIASRIQFQEIGTPLTNEYYVRASRGNLYGTAKTLSQIGPGALPLTTEIANLYHCGASTFAHGVQGALATGVAAAGRILKTPSSRLLDHGAEGAVVLHGPQDHGMAESNTLTQEPVPVRPL